MAIMDDVYAINVAKSNYGNARQTILQRSWCRISDAVRLGHATPPRIGFAQSTSVYGRACLTSTKNALLVEVQLLTPRKFCCTKFHRGF